ncbi:hypothetical protein [Klebsiella pneumoniae IS53]|uniref:Uncharacterized protein n=1 Tax=Klebsiella pneumoniae IS43 TaxID=1432552 RepID=W1DMD6_KLEPN|nr:hypothetical protein [Klebsiella pneumoniae IS43]CDL19262.1 hypothetical protein [Klebsiella pneumoniae IS53]
MIRSSFNCVYLSTTVRVYSNYFCYHYDWAGCGGARGI